MKFCYHKFYEFWDITLYYFYGGDLACGVLSFWIVYMYQGS